MGHLFDVHNEPDKTRRDHKIIIRDLRNVERHTSVYDRT